MDKGKRLKNAQRHTTLEGQNSILLYMTETTTEYPILQHGKCLKTLALHFSWM